MGPGYYVHGLERSGDVYIKEGETKYIPCPWRDYSAAVRCSNRRITHTSCKYKYILFFVFQRVTEIFVPAFFIVS